jgi:hypothetical protein
MTGQKSPNGLESWPSPLNLNSPMQGPAPDQLGSHAQPQLVLDLVDMFIAEVYKPLPTVIALWVWPP